MGGLDSFGNSIVYEMLIVRMLGGSRNTQISAATKASRYKEVFLD